MFKGGALVTGPNSICKASVAKEISVMQLKGQVTQVIKMGLIGICYLAISSCSTLEQNLALGTVGAAVLGGLWPSSEIQQIYYLGVFDPQDQLPPTVYRVRVHGQASAISFTKFASGWVPANLVDSLSGKIGFEKNGMNLSIGEPPESQVSSLKTGRRLMMFGPEGFREAPRNHRLVVVMGSNPEGFFKAIDETLGVVAEVREEQRNAALDRLLFEALTLIKNERERLVVIDEDIKSDLPEESKQ